MRRILTAALALFALGAAHAGTVSVYTTLASWQAAVSGPVQTQDFAGYAAGTDLTGVQILPGVTLSSNLGPVEVFVGGSSQPRAAAFGPRDLGNAYYEGQYAQPFLAAALDIASFESIQGDDSTAVDQGVLSFLFVDGSAESLSISGGDGSPIFIGLVSDSPIVSFRWTEAHEAGGGNEETSLDNLRVALQQEPNQVPSPGSLPLALLALVGVPLARRRRC